MYNALQSKQYKNIKSKLKLLTIFTVYSLTFSLLFYSYFLTFPAFYTLYEYKQAKKIFTDIPNTHLKRAFFIATHTVHFASLVICSLS